MAKVDGSRTYMVLGTVAVKWTGQVAYLQSRVCRSRACGGGKHRHKHQ